MVPATLQKEHVTVLLTRLLDFIIMKIIRPVSTDFQFAVREMVRETLNRQEKLKSLPIMLSQQKS